jgi:zinc protease
MAARLAVLSILATLPLAAQRLPVSEHLLDNGMKVLIHEDHDIPNVAFYLFYRVGSRNERTGATGMSHFFEHMMFNGAKKYGPKEFDIVMERNGGSNNAYTSHDITAYTNWFPAGALELMMEMEADRIQNLAFDPKIIESERGVVYSERRTGVDNNNFGLLAEHLWSTAFMAHPYHWPVIGWASDIESWTLEDLRAHHKMAYAPNNCVVVVAGAVRRDEVLRLAQRHLAPIPRQDPPPPVRTQEPEQIGERRVVIRKTAQAPLIAMAWHIPAASHEDARALEIAARMLSRGRSSRLYSRLVDRERLAIDIDASREDNVDPTLFSVSAQVRPGVAPAKVEAAVEAEIDLLRKQPASAMELEKVRNQVLADLYRGIRTIAGKANLIGRAEIYLGSYKKLDTYADDLNAVTAADVQRVVRKYLQPDKRTVAILEPATAVEESNATR